MAEIRLNKLTRQFNIGLQTLVDFLNEKGAGVDMNPNAKISDQYLPAIEAKFGADQKLKEDSEKVAITIKEIIEKSYSKQVRKEEEDDIIEEEVIIKTTSIAPAPVKEEPVPTKAEIKEETPKETPKIKEEAKKETPKVKFEGPKVIDKIDLSQFEPKKKAEEKEEIHEVEIVKETPKDQEISKTQEASEVKATPEVQETLETKEVKEEKEIKEEVKEKPKKVKEGKKGTVETPETKKKPKKASKPEIEEEEDTSADEEYIEARYGIRKMKIKVEKLAGPKIVDKIDLSQFEDDTKKKSGKKRERIKKGTSQKVDINKVASEAESTGKGGRKARDNRQNNKARQEQGRQNQKSGRGGRRSRQEKGGDKFKPMTEAEREEMQKEIQKQIKETYARMNEGKSRGFGARHRREKRASASQKIQEEIQLQEMEQKILKVTEFVTVNDLANLMGNTPVTNVIGACMSLGLMVSINQRLDAETIILVAEEFGYEVEFVTADLTEAIEQEYEADKKEDLVPRPPVITVMGHVDHGKTSLLDYIRKANVIAGEAGGITQHIGAYNVKMSDGRKITFLDTPGHEAFTAMRARGAKLTDLAIIIVAADDAIMPQTVEAINHAQAAGVPMVFAINKIDKPGANPEKIREQLANMNILVEDWGGKYQCQEISAKKGINIELLLEKVLLEADILELKANPDRQASGAVIESSLDKGRGYMATVLVQNGTLRVGDVMISGSHTGRVRAMFNERGQNVEEAGPSTPVAVLGLNGAPTAGEAFNVMEDEKEARDIANKREQLIRIQGIKAQKHMTLEEIGRRIAIGNFQELNIIVKGDVDGSVEALADSLIKLSTEEIKVNVIHKAVGAISESDILLAAASDAIIIGFQVRPSVNARRLAEQEEIEIRLYSVIYDAIEEVKSGIEGMLEPEKKEEVTAVAEVQEIFKISKVGTIAGCMVREGKLTKNAKVRVVRDGIVVYTSELDSLKRFKDDVKEVHVGMDCGLSVKGFNDIKVGDSIEAYKITEIKRTLK